MELDVLASKNVWWKGKEFFEEDEDYRKWKEKKIKWIPELVDKIKLEPFSLHFIFGPRQSGKTTLIKFIIRKLLEKVDPRAIFYFRCDEIKDYKELKEVLTTYLEFRKELKIKTSYIFLDEITFPKEWFRSIKSMIDDGIFKNDVLVLTGSTSLEIKKEMEWFPGRRGKGKNFLVLPLSFREFIKILNPGLEKNLPEKINSLANAREVRKKILKASIYLKELNEILKLYLRIGGFPLAINSYYSSGRIEESVIQTYLSWIINDITKIGRNWQTAREIMKVLLTKIPSPISWESLAKEMTIKSPKTVSSYLKILSSMFVLIISYQIEPNKILVEFAKNKKIHLLDPLFYQIFEDLCLVKIPERESKIAESALASHLQRFLNKDVFYWKNKSEIDCVVRVNGRLIGFEVKWREKAKPKKIVVGKIKEVYVLSKRDLDLKNRVIPLSLFLALI